MKVTNELDSMCGISDDELTERFKQSIRIDDEIRKIKNPDLQVGHRLLKNGIFT